MATLGVGLLKNLMLDVFVEVSPPHPLDDDPTKHFLN